jgi:hypothetical protein
VANSSIENRKHTVRGWIFDFGYESMIDSACTWFYELKILHPRGRASKTQLRSIHVKRESLGAYDVVVFRTLCTRGCRYIYRQFFNVFVCVFRYTVSVIADGRALGRNRTFRKE